MMAFLIIGAVLLFLLLMPVVLRVRYNERGLTAYGGIFVPFVRIYPLKEEKKKTKKTAKDTSGKIALREQWELIYDLIKRFPIYFKRLVRFRKLEFSAVIGDSDPGDLAMKYGELNAAIGILSPIVDAVYPIEKWNVEISADFERDQSFYRGELFCRTNLWRTAWVLISVLVRGIIIKSDEKEIVEDGK